MADAGPFDAVDRLRRWQGAQLERLGFGAQSQPSEIVLADEGFDLLGYPPIAPDAPPLLLVPAPIKRGYIFDLEPSVSVVARAREAGFAVYRLEWREREDPYGALGLDQFAGRMIGTAMDCVRERHPTGRVVIAGHSLGGTLAAIHAATRPDQVRALIVLEAPLAFAGVAREMAALAQRSPAIESLFDRRGLMPGSVLSLSSVLAFPTAFQWERWVDWVACGGDSALLGSHFRVERWALDEFAMPGRLFAEVVRALYLDDAFMAGALTINGDTVRGVGFAAPLFAVGARDSRVVPASTMELFAAGATHPANRLVWYEGDRGVALQHVGPLVGRSAHHTLWPEILSWLGALPL